MSATGSGRVALVSTVVALLFAACGPSASAPSASTPSTSSPANSSAPSPIGPTSTEPVTLRVWDWRSETDLMDSITQHFQEKYPYITVDRTYIPYAEAIATVKLVASDTDAPDVIEGDQGRDTDGQLVEAGLLLPLDGYAAQYNWKTADLFRWDKGGVWGSGTLYGISPNYRVNGYYYNKEILKSLGLEVPSTLAEFEAMLAKAKAAGIVPIQLGNQSGVSGSFVYEMLQNQFMPADEINDFIYGRNNRTMITDGNKSAAAKLQEWVDKGYFVDGFNGLPAQDAGAAFSDGKGLLLPASASVFRGNPFPELVDKVGLMLVPPVDASKPYQATGGPVGDWHISVNSKQPDIAALYLDYLSEDAIPQGLADMGAARDLSPVKDIVALQKQLDDSNGFVGFLDVSAPGFGDALFAAIQELMANRLTPDEFVTQLDAPYQDYLQSR